MGSAGLPTAKGRGRFLSRGRELEILDRDPEAPAASLSLSLLSLPKESG